MTIASSSSARRLVDRDETAGDVCVVDGDVTIRGTVTGDVVVVDGDVTIRGTVEGNVVTLAGQTTLGRAGRVQGDLIYADEEPVLTPGSQVGGDVEKFDVGDAGILGAIAWLHRVHRSRCSCSACPAAARPEGRRRRRPHGQGQVARLRSASACSRSS